MIDEIDTGELPAEIKTAQRRVTRAISELSPPANFSVLIECLAREIVASGVVSSPIYEDFIRMQVSALVQRVRGVCNELGVELAEPVETAAAPAPVRAPWWMRWCS